jgi:hypothetical protein
MGLTIGRSPDSSPSVRMGGLQKWRVITTRSFVVEVRGYKWG